MIATAGKRKIFALLHKFFRLVELKLCICPPKYTPADTVTSQVTTFADRPLSSRAIAAADALIQCAFSMRVKCYDAFLPLFARLSSIAHLSGPTLYPSANKRTLGRPASRHCRGPVWQTSRRLQGCRGSS